MRGSTLRASVSRTQKQQSLSWGLTGSSVRCSQDLTLLWVRRLLGRLVQEFPGGNLKQRIKRGLRMSCSTWPISSRSASLSHVGRHRALERLAEPEQWLSNRVDSRDTARGFNWSQMEPTILCVTWGCPWILLIPSKPKEDHRVSLEDMDVFSEEEVKSRLKVLGEWKCLAGSSEVSSLQSRHESHACRAAIKLGRKPRTALMEKLGQRYAIEDRAVPMLCLKGLPIVGEALESPFFDDYVVPASIGIKELISTAPTRRQATIKRIKVMAESGSSQLALAIWKKTLKEVDQGSMAGPFSMQEIENRHGRFYNVVPSFGLEQGSDENGLPKYRRIDDHSASHNNHAAGRKQKIEMAGVDYLMVMLAALANKNHTDLVIATEDMKQAYRQVPLPDAQLSLSITGVYCPMDKTVKLFELYGQPFGAAHAVPNFYRVAEWINRVLVRGFKVLLDHFFDDFFVVLRRQEAVETMFVLKEAVNLLGFVFDEAKSQVPARVAMVLGVAFNVSSLHSQKILRVEPKPSRVKNLCEMIDDIIRKNSLSPTQAASVTGKFGFLCSTLFGKVGRCCTGALRARQYAVPDEQELTLSLITSLKLMKVFIKSSPCRQLSVRHSSPPIVLYTDASDVPERLAERWVIGAVLLDPLHPNDVEFTSWVVPHVIIDSCLPKQTYMGQLEILACPMALATWEKRIEHRRIILFVDNDAAAACLVRGYSPKTDSSALVGTFWLLASQCKSEIYIDRVESKSNIADGPSRLDFSVLEAMHATAVSPNTSPLFVSDLSWFMGQAEWSSALSLTPRWNSTHHRERSPNRAVGKRASLPVKKEVVLSQWSQSDLAQSDRVI